MPAMTITNENFAREVMESDVPVLLDFWAEWCGPCRMIGPIVDEIAEEQQAFKVGKINVNNVPELAERFGVMSIPLLVVVNGGKVVAQSEGYRPNQKELILDMLAPFTKASKAIGTASTVVTEINTARAVGSGDLDVFATPMMIALMEEAACDCLAGNLEPGQSSVGTMINVVHVAASPIGATITATATLDETDGRKLTFTVTAKEGDKEIGSGTHTRFLIDAERFMSGLLPL